MRERTDAIVGTVAAVSVALLIAAAMCTACGETGVEVVRTDSSQGDGGPDGTLVGPPMVDGRSEDSASSGDGTDGFWLVDASLGMDAPSGNDTGQTMDPCAGVTCGGHGTCDAATGTCDCDPGYEPQGPTNCVENTDPCANVSCDAESRCENGDCVCIGGFIEISGDCVAPPPGDPATRSAQEVCERWNADWPTRASSVFDPGAGVDACDAGTIDPVAHDDAMRRLNLYRWLVGVDPAGVDPGHQALCQEAALMMHVNGQLSHSPPTSWTCYSQDGATAAGASNLALGIGHPAGTVDAYMGDRGVDSLGHRRWCISPSLDQVGFGHYGSGGAMWSFGGSSKTEPEFVAYPAPGPFPSAAIRGDWSFSRRGALQNPVVTVTDVATGQPLTIEATLRGGSFGFISTIGIRLLDPASTGSTYRIEVESDGGSWTYETTLVDCRTF